MACKLGLGGGLALAKIDFKSEAYLQKLSALESKAKEAVIGPALYEGAAIVADAVKAGIESLPTAPASQWGTPEHPLPGINSKQKSGLIASFGIAPSQDDGTGYFHVKLGFDGYNDIKTKNWPNGQPNQLIARSAERGTSFMNATPFMKKSVAKARKRCETAMQARVEEEIQKIMK